MYYYNSVYKRHVRKFNVPNKFGPTAVPAGTFKGTLVTLEVYKSLDENFATAFINIYT